MADAEGQTGTEERKGKDLGSSLVNPGEQLTGVSNGAVPEIVVNKPAAPVSEKAAAASTEGTAVAANPDEEIDPLTGKPKPKLPLVSQQVQQQPGDKPKADEYQRDAAVPPGGADPEAGEDGAPIRDTKKMRQLLNDKWGLQWPDPLLQKIMQEGSVTKGLMGGIVFELGSGETIKWHENLLQQGEFIGKTGFFAKVNEAEAEATVAIAKNRGWTKLNVYGNREQKELFWLEAKKQGLEVANFQPMADSPIMQKWADLQASRADKTLHGVQNGDNALLNVTGEVKPGADEKAGSRTATPAEEKPAATGEAVAATAAADGSKPAVVESSIAGKLTATAPTASESTPAIVARAEGESLNDFFGRKIEESSHPRMKQGLERIRDKLSGDGVDEAVVKQVCDMLGQCKPTLQTHNDVVAVVNEKITGGEPLVELGYKNQARRGGPQAPKV